MLVSDDVALLSSLLHFRMAAEETCVDRGKWFTRGHVQSSVVSLQAHVVRVIPPGTLANIDRTSNKQTDRRVRLIVVFFLLTSL